MTSKSAYEASTYRRSWLVTLYILCNQPTSQSQCNSLEKKCFQERIKKKRNCWDFRVFVHGLQGKTAIELAFSKSEGNPKSWFEQDFKKKVQYLSKIALNQFRVVAKFILLPYSSIFFQNQIFASGKQCHLCNAYWRFCIAVHCTSWLTSRCYFK